MDEEQRSYLSSRVEKAPGYRSVGLEAGSRPTLLRLPRLSRRVPSRQLLAAAIFGSLLGTALCALQLLFSAGIPDSLEGAFQTILGLSVGIGIYLGAPTGMVWAYYRYGDTRFAGRLAWVIASTPVVFLFLLGAFAVPLLGANCLLAGVRCFWLPSVWCLGLLIGGILLQRIATGLRLGHRLKIVL